MEAVFRNDINEGNRTIIQLSRVLQTPYKSKIISQIIFQQTYPRFFRKESHNVVALVSVYIASKINETLVKLELILEAVSMMGYIDASISRDRLIILECRMIELFGFKFDIRPAQFFLLRIGKTLNIDVLKRLIVLDDVHGDNRVNFIDYFDGMYKPELVALGALSDHELQLFECFFCVSVDRPVIEEIRTVLFKK